LAEIRPFRGVHYNQSLVKDPAQVLCPPYDIISPALQHQLYHQNEANFVRVEFGREFPQDTETDNRYTRALDTAVKWLEQGILKVDEEPSLYIHDHNFTHQGKKYRRRSITCLVKLEEWIKMVVRPHEGTLSEPKSDRLSMLWTLQANTSPILALYEDSKGKVSSILEAKSHVEPVIGTRLEDAESHQLWAVKDAASVSQICGYLKPQPIYIADGHHRYESALAYQRERRVGCMSEPGQEPYDFVMMTLVDFSDPGLVILPAHRLIRGLSKSTLDALTTGLETFFSVEQTPLKRTETRSQIDDLLSYKSGKVKFMLCGLVKDILLALELRDYSLVRQMIPYFHSDIYQKLDVSIVDHVILEEIMGMTPDSSAISLGYSHDALDAINMVQEEEYQLAFIVNPVRPDVIKAVADSGDRMPRKSTYFYPKSPAGLVFYRFAEA
jgi:uncharacterized protein (DUF1015 family)